MIFRPRHEDLDTAMAAATRGAVIELAPGVYTTRGNWSAKGPGYKQLADGVRLIGAGSDRTIIRLDRHAERRTDDQPRPDRDLNVLWTGADVTVHGVTLDGNERAFGSERHLQTEPPWYVGGLRYHGRVDLEDITVIGLRGDWKASGTLHPEIEVFGISGRGETGGSRIHRVRVQDCAESSYVSGVFHGAGTTIDDTAFSLVTDVRVDLGRDNQFGLAANVWTRFRDVEASGVRYGFYNDTGPTFGVEIRDVRLRASYAAIALVSQAPTDRRRLRLIGGSIEAPRLVEIVQRPGGASHADVAITGLDAAVEYVACVDNPAPCVVRVEGCTLPDGAVRFRTRRSPEPVTRANYRPDGSGHPNALKTLVA